nr:ABC transporter permease [uncultured Actinoplanes sp.]
MNAVTTAEAPGPAVTRPGHDGGSSKPRSLAGDAWLDLRRSKVFWIATALVVVVLVMAVWPSLFSSADPGDCRLAYRHQPAGGTAPFGYDFQGCNVYARTVYGARASILVALFATVIAGVIGLVVGLAAGFYGRWVDALLSRFVDIVLGIPFLLAAIVLSRRLTTGEHDSGMLAVTLTLGLLGWTTAARVMRSAVISAKNQDYVTAARMLGAGPGRLMVRHILPNAIGPFLVVLTLLLGVNVAAEATLSYLGVGLSGEAISWGTSIADAGPYVRTAAAPVVWPSVFLAGTVLAFIMLGDAVRDAFDPKLR